MIKKLLIETLRLLANSMLWVTACASASCAWLSWVLDGRIDWLGCGAYALFSFVIYCADRLSRHEEDARSVGHPFDAASYVQAHRRVFLVLAATALAGLLGLGIFYPWFWLATLLSFVAAIFYIIPLPWTGKRLKEIPYFKDGYVQTITCLFQLLFLARPIRNAGELLIVGFYLLFLQMNTMAFDLKDVEADRASGLRMLSTTFSRHTILRFLILKGLLCASLSAWLLPSSFGHSLAIGFIAASASCAVLLVRWSRTYLVLGHEGMLIVPLLMRWWL